MFFWMFQENNFKNLPHNEREPEWLTLLISLVFNTIHCKNLKPGGKRPICALVSIYFQTFAILCHLQVAPAPY